MAKSFSQSVQIDVSPDYIYEWLQDWNHVKEWMGPTLISIEVVSDHPADTPFCKGLRFRETRKMGRMNAKAIVEVIRHEVDASGVFHHEAIFDDGCNRMIAEYQYSPCPQGSTATFKMFNAPNKWWTKAMCVITGPMMIKMCSKTMADHLPRLKALVESDAPRVTSEGHISDEH